MFDLHILYHKPSTQPEWWEICVRSAQEAEQRGLCKVHLIETKNNRIGEHRAKAYQKGQHEFVACLDSDDVLIVDGLPKLLSALHRHREICGVYSDRQQINAKGEVLFDLARQPWSPIYQLCQSDYPHQLAIYRREAIQPHLKIISYFDIYSDFVLSGLVSQYGNWLYVPTLCYQRREKDYYKNHRRPIDIETYQRAKSLVSPVLIKKIKEMSDGITH